MKKFLLNGFLLLLAIVVLSQCKKNDDNELQLIQISKVMSVDAMRALPVGLTKATRVKNPGKIYIYNDYLFINEPNKGIHIYNNTNPAAPINMAFLQIPGNVDIAIRNNVLYADSYVDLLAFDISSISNIKQIKRLPDVFKQFYWGGFMAQGTQRNVVTYKDTLVRKSTYKSGWANDIAAFSNSANSSSSGQGGSMARFTLLNDYLYTVGNMDLSLFDIKTATNPSFIKSIVLGWGVETIFPYENKLFIGTNTGMHIFSAAQPENPVKLSTYSHVFACDPVVVQGKYAFVTLRTGTICRQGSNQLEVVDIEDPTKPKQVSVFPMKNPHGLSVSGNNLFLCEGEFGVKSFNITNKTEIDKNMLQHLTNIKSYDVIAGPKSLIVTGADGVYQFTYFNPVNMKQLSLIKVDKTASIF